MLNFNTSLLTAVLLQSFASSESFNKHLLFSKRHILTFLFEGNCEKYTIFTTDCNLSSADCMKLKGSLCFSFSECILKS